MLRRLCVKPTKHIRAKFVELLGCASNAGLQWFAKINYPLGLEKTPAGVRLVSGLIFYQTVGAEFAKATRRQKCFDMSNKPRTDAPTPRSRLHPNAFEKRHRLAFAAIGRFADGYLGES